jgi:hypothetical protein
VNWLLTQQQADAIKDYSYISQLQSLPDNVGLKQRINLEHAFPGLANAYPGDDDNAPYDTRYLTFRGEAFQQSDGVREALRKSLPKGLSWSDKEKSERRSDYSQGMLPKNYSPFLDRLARFLIGTAGGCSLIVPMLIMIFDQSLTKSLITTSVAVILFALVLSLVFETDNKDTITATATYAAVLVVFVGTSANTPGPGG